MVTVEICDNILPVMHCPTWDDVLFSSFLLSLAIMFVMANVQANIALLFAHFLDEQPADNCLNRCRI